MTEPIRVGLIGCGNNMAGHVKRMLPNADARIVGLADPEPAGIAHLRDLYPALVDVAEFSHYADLLQSVRPDAVIISTPHSLHYEQIMAALESGCHVLCEKPLVLHVAHARDAIRQSRHVGRHLLVSYQRHYAPVFRRMRQLIGDGQIGTVRFVQALQNQNWYQRQKAANRWRIVPELSGGGQLNDSGSHLIDILLHVTGLTVESVFCRQERLDLDVDVNSALTLGFTNGAIGSLAIVGDAPGIGGQVWEDITIYGSEGAIYYRMMGGILDRAPLIELRAQA
ncbi:MAG TPA: Gfo/Idh/MocA family oxidoreductase, partial [Chloroflexota bacterium]|nr:Gfo/Idh/MocA family oxidoreductase [Chloroflexota bacterium]